MIWNKKIAATFDKAVVFLKEILVVDSFPQFGCN